MCYRGKSEVPFNLSVKKLCGFIGVHKMGEYEGCRKLGRMVPRDDSVDAYHFSLLLSPVVSVWDCIVRKMRYSFRPEWV
ncbi:hypothetical protein SADUNF_Sadunf17G0130100 [Salix dunnii]|uniref:Uncharacterized protein n=1 Tax=Salix dunnii TaxID=1413687 RepID=A0A835J438_9ROSI|nr:hypothetical protein SADUNF_Sadunf17G0130100 [Salix dunnii]